jgi:hypothetical protein
MARWMTIDQKRQIIAKSGECTWLTHLELADWAARTYALPVKPARSTITSLLRKASCLTSEAYADGRRRKPLKVMSMRLEQRLAEWVQAFEAKNLILSRAIITMKAQELQVELCDAWDLNFSDGWLTRFLRRHGLKSRRLQGEAASASPEEVYRGHQQLQEVTDLYPARTSTTWTKPVFVTRWRQRAQFARRA